MPAYILRFAGTNDLAGFYSASDESALLDLIDEETDPGDYEYAALSFGFGIRFRKGKEWLDVRIGKEKEIGRTLAQTDYVDLTDELTSALGSAANELNWLRFGEL